MNPKLLAAAAAAVLGGAIASAAQATTFTLNLTGDPSTFSESHFNFNHLNYDEFYMNLSGLDSSNAITVAQGDTINSTVTMTAPVTIGTDTGHTDILQFLSGSPFPSVNTGVNGTFTFYNGSNVVGSFGYGSTTSGELAAYAAVFPPNNGSFTFTSFTDNFTINTLSSPGTLSASSFEYALANTVPEPASWAIMLIGFGGLGLAMRSRRRAAAFA
jgi:hypothetical protein